MLQLCWFTQRVSWGKCHLVHPTGSAAPAPRNVSVELTDLGDGGEKELGTGGPVERPWDILPSGRRRELSVMICVASKQAGN